MVPVILCSRASQELTKMNASHSLESSGKHSQSHFTGEEAKEQSTGGLLSLTTTKQHGWDLSLGAGI